MNKDKLEELLNMTKLAELVNTKQKDDEKKCNTVLWVLAIVGAVAADAVYRFLTPDYLEDFDDDFDEDFDDDFFEDEEEETPEKKEEEDTEE